MSIASTAAPWAKPAKLIGDVHGRRGKKGILRAKRTVSAVLKACRRPTRPWWVISPPMMGNAGIPAKRSARGGLVKTIEAIRLPVDRICRRGRIVSLNHELSSSIANCGFRLLCQDATGSRIATGRG